MMSEQRGIDQGGGQLEGGEGEWAGGDRGEREGEKES